MDATRFSRLWDNIVNYLDKEWNKEPHWRQRIIGFGQVPAINEREKGRQWSDREIFGGIIKAVLSNQTDWSRIERVLGELCDLFCDFDIQYYSSLNASEIENRFVPWFKARKAGSMAMKQDLKNLIKTANMLLDFSSEHGSLEKFIGRTLQNNNSDVKLLVYQFGSPKGQYKLPAIGIPIAAEALKNIGFDAAKPDAHFRRALGCFGLVEFRNWPDRSKTKPPAQNESECMETMKITENFAKEVGEKAAFLDNAVWLLCAKSGLHLSNDQLRNLGSL